MIYMSRSESRLLRIFDEDHLSYFVQMPFKLPADTDLNSPQIKLISEWNEGFLQLNVDTLAKHVHKDFRRVVYPRSIGHPEQNKEEWIQEITGVIGFTTGFDVGENPCHSNSCPPG